MTRLDVSIELLQNGFVLIEDRKSGLRGLYDPLKDSWRHGDLSRVISSKEIASFIRSELASK